MIDFGFLAAPHGLGFDRIGWHAYAGNFDSARVAQKAGFSFEGTIRDGAIGRVALEDDWVARSPWGDALTVHQWPILPLLHPAAGVAHQ